MSVAPQRPVVEIRDLQKFAMYTDSPNGDNARSALIFGVRDGNPRISVFPGGESYEERYPIFAGFDVATWGVLLDFIEEIYRGENGLSGKLETKRTERDSDVKVTLSFVEYGKDEKGVCWIAMTHPERPRIRFNFTLSDWHVFYHSDGTQLTEGEVSQRLAISSITSLRNIMYRYTGELRELAAPNKNSRNKQSTPTPEGAEDFTGDF